MTKTRDLLFVLGAGTSYDYGFPLGVGLKEAVIHDLKSSQQATSQVAGDRLARLNPDSLDDFSRLIEHEANSVAAMKSSITRKILQFESKCWRSTVEIRQKTDDWIRKIGEGLWGSSNHFHLNIITFNYDRLLEWRLNQWICGKMNCSESDAWDALYSKVTIHHVYGRLPALSEKEAEVLRMDRNFICSFGNMRDESSSNPPGYVASVVGQAKNFLKTIYETANAEQGETIEQKATVYRELIKKCKTVHIFGFGYNDQNLKILGLPYAETDNFGKRRRVDFAHYDVTRVSLYGDEAPTVNCVLHPGDASAAKQRINDFKRRFDCGARYSVHERSILNYIATEEVFGHR